MITFPFRLAHISFSTEYICDSITLFQVALTFQIISYDAKKMGGKNSRWVYLPGKEIVFLTKNKKHKSQGHLFEYAIHHLKSTRVLNCYIIENQKGIKAHVTHVAQRIFDRKLGGIFIGQSWVCHTKLSCFAMENAGVVSLSVLISFSFSKTLCIVLDHQSPQNLLW